MVTRWRSPGKGFDDWVTAESRRATPAEAYLTKLILVHLKTQASQYLHASRYTHPASVSRGLVAAKSVAFASGCQGVPRANRDPFRQLNPIDI
jgi:hypothetical protein